MSGESHHPICRVRSLGHQSSDLGSAANGVARGEALVSQTLEAGDENLPQ